MVCEKAERLGWWDVMFHRHHRHWNVPRDGLEARTANHWRGSIVRSDIHIVIGMSLRTDQLPGTYTSSLEFPYGWTDSLSSQWHVHTEVHAFMHGAYSVFFFFLSAVASPPLPWRSSTNQLKSPVPLTSSVIPRKYFATSAQGIFDHPLSPSHSPRVRPTLGS